VPFDPIPETMTELCRAAPDGFRAVELGCGDGGLLARLRQCGVWCAGLDLAPRALARAVDVRGDARRPPLRAASLDLVVAANLVRHLISADPRLRFLDAWLGLLRPGGSVFVLEDEPSAEPAAANHRDLQAFLARLFPDGRGPLVARDAFVRALPDHLSARVAGTAVGANASRQDAQAAIAMLERGNPEAGGEAARLLAAIRLHGLACGRMWWLQLRAE
jgi:SAM-dependent methyltransferase